MSPPCPRPLADEALLDWWTGEMHGVARRGVEEHLLGCDSCTRRLAALSALGEGVSDLVRAGVAPAVVTSGVLERLRRDGCAIREYRVPAGGGVHCTVGPEDRVLVVRLQAGLDAVARVDLVSRIDEGPERRIPDVPFDPGAGELIMLGPIEEIRARPVSVERMRLLAVEPGGERLLGEYTFDHTPWPGRPEA